MRRSSTYRQGADREQAGIAQEGGDEKAVEAAAVRLLARREHSTEELRRKLVGKGHPAALVAGVVEKLSARRRVSDERFIAGFVHHHASRGQGPVRIGVELRRQGIAAARIEQELRGSGLDWSRLAAEVRRRKFGAAQPRGRGERAKQMRFLQYRGFDAEQIRAALSFDPDTDCEPDPGFDPDRADLHTEGSGDEPGC